MTTKEFESLTGGIVLNLIRYDRGEMSKEMLMQNMKIMLGKETFEKAIDILDENK